MYFLGTFAAEQAAETDDHDDLDFFPFPTLGTEFDAEIGIDAPIDGFMLSKAPEEPRRAPRRSSRASATGAAQIVYLDGQPDGSVAAGNDADTSGYTAVQKKSAEIIAAPALSPSSSTATPARTSPARRDAGASCRTSSNEPDQDLARSCKSIQASGTRLRAVVTADRRGQRR